jgi:hypothetical protein
VLGSALRGGAWSQRPTDGSKIGVCAQQACGTTVVGDGAYATLNLGSVNHKVQAQVIQPVGSTGTAGLVFRARSGWDRFLLAELTQAGQIIVWRYDGSWTALGQAIVSLSNGSSNTLAAIGDTTTAAVTWNGTQVLSVADINDATATYGGIYVGVASSAGSRPTLDDFVATTGPGVTQVATATSTPTGATPTPGIGASDSFNRTSTSGSLGRADSGQAWQTDSASTWAICSNVRACPVAPVGGEAWARVETNLVDQRITVVTTTRPTTSSGMAGVFARSSADFQTDLIWVGLDATGRIEVWTLSNGSWSGAAVASKNTSLNSSVQRTLVAQVAGTQLKVYVDDTTTPQLTVTVPSSSSTMAGIYSANTDAAAGNWPMFESFSVS